MGTYQWWPPVRCSAAHSLSGEEMATILPGFSSTVLGVSLCDAPYPIPRMGTNNNSALAPGYYHQKLRNSELRQRWYLLMPKQSCCA